MNIYIKIIPKNIHRMFVYSEKGLYSYHMKHMKAVNNVQMISKCCEFPIWRTSTFPDVRKKIGEIGEDLSLNLGVCNTCESFFLIENFEQLERTH
jgi:hypothetical protein